MVTAWRMRRELGMEIAHRIYLYLVQKYPLGKKKQAQWESEDRSAKGTTNLMSTTFSGIN